MAMTTEKSGQIVRAPANGGGIAPAQDQQKAMGRLIENLKGELARALPKHLTPDRLARLALTALRTTPKLAECSQASFAGCLMSCAALGLEPNTPLGEAHLIPRWNSRTRSTDCTLIVGYQGYMSLARRSGEVSTIQAFPVFAGDVFEYELGLHPMLRHVPSGAPDRENPDKLTHVYAIVRPKDKDAEPIFTVMSRAQVESHRKRGASGSKRNDGSTVKTPWDTDYVAMAQKTAVREVFRWAPRSAELARADAIEGAIERGTSVIRELPEETAHALLGAGIAPDDVTDDGEALDAELDSTPVASRQPGEEG
jgi:recombination protein RecT